MKVFTGTVGFDAKFPGCLLITQGEAGPEAALYVSRHFAPSDPDGCGEQHPDSNSVGSVAFRPGVCGFIRNHEVTPLGRVTPVEPRKASTWTT